MSDLDQISPHSITTQSHEKKLQEVRLEERNCHDFQTVPTGTIGNILRTTMSI